MRIATSERSSRLAALERWLRAADEQPTLDAIATRFRCGLAGANRLLEQLRAAGAIDIIREPGRRPRIALIEQGKNHVRR